MNREGSDADLNIEEEAKIVADDITTRSHLQVRTSYKRLSF